MIQKSLNRKAWLTPLLLVLLVFACQKNDEAMDTRQADSQTSLSPEVGAAKAWFEGSHAATRQSTSIGIGEAEKGAISYRLGAINARPKWSEAWVGKDEVVEVPLDLTAKTAYSTGPNATGAELDAQVTRLLVLNDKQGKPLAVLMHIMSDVEHLQKKRYSLTANRYKNVEADFTGSVLYTFLDGTFCNGWQYEGGKVAKRISAAPYEPQPIRSGIHCITTTYYFWTLGCVDKGTYLDCGEWRLTDSYSMTVCSPWSADAGGDPGGGSGPGDGGGSPSGDGSGNYDGGVEPPDTPDTPDNDPCVQAKILQREGIFKSLMADLKNSAGNESREIGYFYASDHINPSGDLEVTRILGNEGEDYIEVPMPPEPIDVFIHEHYKGLSSTFTGADIYALYRLLDEGKLKNPATFTFGVVTEKGSTYLLLIENTAKFRQFGEDFFGGTASARQADGLVNSSLQFIGVSQESDISTNERWLFAFLQSSKTGLSLFKGESTNFSSWEKLEKNGDGKIVTQPCP